MPQDFSFNNDIAPMRGSFFQSGLSSREGSYLAKKYGPDMDDMKDMLTIQSRLASIRNSDMAYERNLFALQTAKEQYANERDAYNKLPTLLDDVRDIKNNVELDPYAKQEAYNSLSLRYPHLLTTNKVAGTMVTGAMAANDVALKKIASQERKDFRDISLTQAAPDAQAAAEIAAQRNGVSPVEATIISGRTRKEASAEARALRAAQKEAKSEITSHYKTQIADLGEIKKDLLAIKDLSVEDQRNAWSAGSPPREDKVAFDAYQKSQPKFTPTLSELDRERVKAHAITLGLHESMDIDSMDPVELRTAVLKRRNAQDLEVRKIMGRSASTKTTTSSAGIGFKTR